ncbi:MAG: sulfotransferase domain-containing protein [Cytophagales bacterium]
MNDKIDVMIVGAQKAGTTSLHQYLKSHPNISGHINIEFSYFSDPELFARPIQKVIDKQFVIKEQSKYLLAKNVAIVQHEQNISNLYSHNPECKIVFVLRNPTSRIYSDYHMAVKDGWVNEKFETIGEVIQKNDQSSKFYTYFLRYGFYAEQLDLLLKYFKAEQIKIFFYEDMKNHSAEICNEIYSWLKLAEHNTKVDIIYNQTHLPKSNTLAKILHSLKSKNGYYLKSLLKQILPYKVFLSFGRTIEEINESKNLYEPVKEDTKSIIDDFYKPYNEKLNIILNNDTLKKSVIRYSDNLWA